MVQIKILFLIGLLAAPAYARDLRPSVGVSYSQTDLSQPTSDPISTFQGWHERRYILDAVFPVQRNVEFVFSGARTFLTVDTWARTYQLIAVTQDPYGNIFGTYGEKGAYRRHESLDGYEFKAGMRFYF